ncbi:MAG TPA: M1 family aminopeptidase [Kofleriaceae bacterium]|nr:M1 family aminopeptidase [Kofleriaceae bacterium]
MRMFLAWLLLLGCSSSSPAVTRTTPPATPARPADGHADRGLEPAAPALRLPRNFLPVRYAAQLAIDPARRDFDGAIGITGRVAERSSVIWLHGHQLAIRHAVARRAGVEIPVTATPRGTELLELRAASPLDPGEWTLVIAYAGVYDELNTTGAFKQTVAGAPYVYSQFEALYARRVFPCFDEPDSKVPWQLTLDVPADLVAVSNTSVVREQALGDGRKRVEFATTRPLPSYLLAFGVGPFDVVQAGATPGGAPIRVITMKGRAREAAWAARTTPRIVALLEELFGSKYPYDKLDMLAIPVTVGFGAMENAGLVTFTETLMLLDPAHAARQREYDWVNVAAHELGHQWFGDLVTTAWWNDIWLNEGFANWVERKISTRFEPAWHEEIAEIEIRSMALDDDALVSARRIRQPIVASDDILNAFDGITYDKGASVLNMFESYVGRDVFLRGVRAYIAQHAFGNATSDEFAAAISQAAGKDLGLAFASFLEQPGAPELTARVSCERGRPPHVALRQARFVPPGAPAPPPGKPWIVPVCIAFDAGGRRGETCTLLDATEAEVALPAASCPRWVMPNASGRGYYRTAYTAADVTALRDLAWPELTAAERSALVFDASSAAMVGKLPLPLALSFVPRLLASGDRFSIRAALAIPFAVRDLVPDGLRASYEAWVRTTLGPTAHRVGLAARGGDGLDAEAARTSLIELVGDLARDPALAGEAVKLSPRWRELPQATRRNVVLLASHARPEVFARMLADVRDEPDRDRREELLYALATTRDPDQQRSALALVLDPLLDIRDTQAVLVAPTLEASRVVAQRFFQDHRAAILARIPADGTASGQAWLAGLFTASCSAERRGELADYVTATFAGLPGGARTVQQAIEAMDQCIARRKLLEPAIRDWLGAGRGGATGAVSSRRARGGR